MFDFMQTIMSEASGITGTRVFERSLHDILSDLGPEVLNTDMSVLLNNYLNASTDFYLAYAVGAIGANRTLHALDELRNHNVTMRDVEYLYGAEALGGLEDLIFSPSSSSGDNNNQNNNQSNSSSNNGTDSDKPNVFVRFWRWICKVVSRLIARIKHWKIFTSARETAIALKYIALYESVAVDKKAVPNLFGFGRIDEGGIFKNLNIPDNEDVHGKFLDYDTLDREIPKFLSELQDTSEGAKEHVKELLLDNLESRFPHKDDTFSRKRLLAQALSIGMHMCSALTGYLDKTENFELKNKQLLNQAESGAKNPTISPQVREELQLAKKNVELCITTFNNAEKCAARIVDLIVYIYKDAVNIKNASKTNNP